jgi:hypothetical protein
MYCSDHDVVCPSDCPACQDSEGKCPFYNPKKEESNSED